MGGLDVKLRLKPCKWCKRPIKQRRWWRPKRYCNQWHQAKYRAVHLVANVLDSF
ncbi:hypothetical protein [Streptomyces finlayi]|uniref:hypothetical protein n=1 Tax=Streptomyces finlayi TaxID=67296 RepID=UPI001624C857|nr:hypothetical protein [Streptomyces finlayi]